MRVCKHTHMYMTPGSRCRFFHNSNSVLQTIIFKLTVKLSSAQHVQIRLNDAAHYIWHKKETKTISIEFQRAPKKTNKNERKKQQQKTKSCNVHEIETIVSRNWYRIRIIVANEFVQLVSFNS